MVAAAVVGAAVVGGAMSANAQEDAANTAANAQKDSAAMGVAEQRRQFNAIQELLKPYVNAGPGALTGQQNLLGLNGNQAQQGAIDGIQNSSLFGSLSQQGENAILQNASATGGLRGGNTQAALAQFRPQLLNQLINDQYAKLGGLTTLGQNSAVGVGNAGQNSAKSITNLFQQQGAASAGAALASGKAQAGMYGNIAGAVGTYAGMGGFGNTGTPYQSPYDSSSVDTGGLF